MRKRLLFLLLLSLLVCLFVGCSKRTLNSVQVQKNAFKESYAVDEPISYDGAYLLVLYSTGEKEEVPITADMVTGLDTSTTGAKTLTVQYKDVISDPVSYRVYNPEDASREIVTKARLVLYADEGTGYIDYTVRISTAGLHVTAAEFTLTSEQSLAIGEDLGNLSAVSDSSSATYAAKISSDGKKLKTVVFYEDGRTFVDGSVVVRFRVQGGNNRSVRLTNNTLSDGEKDYYLPIAA